MSSIVQLDQNTINKIAAGEVIERPSAVVKELVENAIDAKASAITVEIKEGGISLIRITDNGKGIASDDVKTAFLRHATSKITSVEDLFFVKSLGFRGEALSSIAAVAMVELITKTSEDVVGTRYVIEGGVEKEMTNVGCPDGTTFIVRDLFYNTPVRRKFLKTYQTEAGYIYDLLERLAVSNPNVSFKFVNNGQVKLQTQGNGNLADIIYSIYGKEIYSNMVEVVGERKNVSLTGYIGKPIISRGNRNYENYFINGRYIKSAIIYKAIEEAYKPYSMVHKYPFVSLNLTIDQKLIDVNVHPTKMEIRFANSHEVYEIVYTTIKNALDNANRIPLVELSEEKNKEKQVKNKDIPEPFEVNRKKEYDKAYQKEVEKKLDINNVREDSDPFKSYNSNKKVGFSVSDDEAFSYTKAKSDEIFIEEGFSKEKYGQDIKKEEQENNNEIKDNKLKDKENNVKTDEVKDKDVNDNENKDKENKVKDSNVEIDKVKIDGVNLAESVTSLEQRLKQKYGDNTKALSEEKDVNDNKVNDNKTNDSITNENQTNERITKDDNHNNDIKKAEQVSMFETVKEEKRIRIVGQVFLTYWIVEYDEKMFIIDQHAAHEKVMYERFMKSYNEKKPMSQMVAPPIMVSLSMREEEILKNNMELFNNIGFEIEHFGGMDYMISAVPLDMYGIASNDLFMQILDTLPEGVSKKSFDIILEKIASMSCKAAVKGNNKLSVNEAQKLIEEMMRLDNPYNCPHGRPTVIELTKKELEKKFKRQL